MFHINLRGGGIKILNCLIYMKFGQLVIRKIIKIIATTCHILRINAQNSIPAGAPPQTPLGELTALPQIP